MDDGAAAAGLATRLLVVRHGQTAWNAEARIQGHTDVDLDATGRAQAEQLAAALADADLDAIYASDLRRAGRTATAVAARHALAVRTDTALRERGFGRFEGLRFDEIAQRWPHAAARWRARDPGFAAPEGETLAAFHARCVEAAARIARRHRGQQVLLVAHGGVLDCLYRAATGLRLDAARAWPLGNAAINRLLHTDQGFALVGWNDAAHLEGSAPALGDRP